MIDREKLLEALRAALLALNTVPRTQINHPTLRDTYKVAALIEATIRSLEDAP